MLLSRRVLFLLSLIVLGAIAASLTLSIGKVDLGAVGGTLVYLGLIVLAGLLAKRPDEFFSPDAPPAERQGWVSLIFVALIALGFVSFLVALPALGAEADRMSNSLSRPFGVHLGMLIFGWAVCAGLVRGAQRDAVELDERDLRIRDGAQRLAAAVMSCVMIGAIVLLVMRGAEMQAWLRPLVVANLLLGLLIVRHLSECLYVVVRYWQARR